MLPIPIRALLPAVASATCTPNCPPPPSVWMMEGAYELEQHRWLILLYGFDPLAFAFVFEAQALWMLGYPDQAPSRIDEGLALARQIAHPYID